MDQTAVVSKKLNITSLKADALSGFFVFLIALPLCLGISLASGYPAVAGIITAIVGGLVVTWASNSQLTIKGPAAGLIIIALGCVTDFGFTGGKNLAADVQAYRMALGVGVAAGVLQIAFGLLRLGVLGELFPTSVIHGMLAAIGIIIFAKQLPILLGVSASGEPLHLLAQIPSHIMNMNPEIAVIGLLSLALLITLPQLKYKWTSRIPGPIFVIAVAIPLGIMFDLSHDHTYSWAGHLYRVGENLLVPVPKNIFTSFTLPDFSGLLLWKAWKWVLMFSLIGSIESLLSAKAIDMIDPQKRKTNYDKDLLAVGLGNTLSACLGGLPMISEIVRSRANIDNGAETRLSNFFHSAFLLLAVACIPQAIHRVPLAALAAMLVYTGFRLAHPREFMHALHIGKEQLIIFCSTILGVLATDLLVGIFIGIGVKAAIHLYHGAPLSSLFKSRVDVKEANGSSVVTPQRSAVFSHWISLKRSIETEQKTGKKVVIDLSQTFLVDHTVMSKLHELKENYSDEQMEIVGLHRHRSVSRHPLAASRRRKDGPSPAI